MVKRRPDLFSAYVGTAQLTGPRGTRMGYEMALKSQRQLGNAAGVAALERIGPPPWDTFDKVLVRQQFTNPPGQPMSPLEIEKSAAAARFLADHPLDPKYIAYPTPPPEFVPARDGVKLFMDTAGTVMTRERGWEIRNYGRDWPIPMFVFQGELDFNAPEPLAREWIDEIRAPKKGYAMITGAGHNTGPFHDELLFLLRQYKVADIARHAA
jgi:pimeloyl-ACP methyl ester carboxylesterase